MIDSVEFIMLTTTALIFTAVVGTISIEMRLLLRDNLDENCASILMRRLEPGGRIIVTDSRLGKC
jgi:hypothetical protein